MSEVQVVPIMTKGAKRRGVVYEPQATEAVAHIVRNQSIRLTGRYNNSDVDITFSVGDTAEYDSYNLHYLGKIEKITDKGVTITPEYSTRTKRLSLHEFLWRNYDFDLERIAARNHDTRQYI